MDDSPIVPGYRLGRYELLCLIASGGMASVWLARLLGVAGFEKLVAIKTIRAELIKDPRFREMFLDEARIASGIEHPNVGHIVDLGEQDDNLYIIMEWIDGESLARISSLTLKRGMALPLPLSLRVIADMCAGLHAAHELRNVRGASLGIVHRDVSPDNVLITVAGTVKVIDFGIAKAQQRGAGETAAGTLKGKLRYMAPEQVSGAEVGRRADIWAAGMCLAELVTGREPFGDLTEIEVMRRLMGPEPAPKLDNIELELPASIRKIFDRTLAADPNKRFETAADMRRAIEGAIAELGAPASSEDLADFVRTNFADLARRRREAVVTAVEEADVRAGAPKSVRSENLPEVREEALALAPTQVVDLGDPQPAFDPPVTVASTTAGATTLSRRLEEHSSRGRMLAIVGAFAATAAVIAAFWIGRSGTPAVPPLPVAPTASAATPPSNPVPTAPVVSAATPVTPVVSAVAPAPSAAATPSSVASVAPTPSAKTTATASATETPPALKPAPREDAGTITVRPQEAPSSTTTAAPAPTPTAPAPDEPTPP